VTFHTAVTLHWQQKPGGEKAAEHLGAVSG